MYDQQQNQYYAYNNNQQNQQQQYYQPQAFDQDDKKQYNYADAYTADFADSYVRADFVKKVYSLLTIELGITLGMIALGLYTGMQSWLVQIPGGEDLICFCTVGQMEQYRTNTEYCACGYYVPSPYPTALFYVSFFVSIILQCVLYCGGNIARKAPLNFVVLLLYIIFFGFMLTTICIYFAYYCGTAIVWQAWGITFGIVFGLTAYACKTQTDFSYKIGAIFILMPTMLMLIIFLCFWPSYALYICLCSLFVVLYGFYLIWETQLIMGKGKLKLSIDDYVIGSLLLYATIIQMFLRILEILAIARGK